MGLDDAKLVQRERLVPACLLLPGQVERLAGVLPGLLAVSRQTTDLAEPCDPEGLIWQRARADTFADPLLQQRAPLREASLERRGIAQARRDTCTTRIGYRRHDREPGTARTPGWRAPGPLGRGTGSRGSRGQRSVYSLGLPAWRGGAPPPHDAGPRQRPRARPKSAPAARGNRSASLY